MGVDVKGFGDPISLSAEISADQDVDRLLREAGYRLLSMFQEDYGLVTTTVTV
jgi:hypothetical protein